MQEVKLVTEWYEYLIEAGIVLIPSLIIAIIVYCLNKKQNEKISRINNDVQLDIANMSERIAFIELSSRYTFFTPLLRKQLGLILRKVIPSNTLEALVEIKKLDDVESEINYMVIEEIVKVIKLCRPFFPLSSNLIVALYIARSTDRDGLHQSVAKIIKEQISNGKFELYVENIFTQYDSPENARLLAEITKIESQIKGQENTTMFKVMMVMLLLGIDFNILTAIEMMLIKLASMPLEDFTARMIFERMNIHTEILPIDKEKIRVLFSGLFDAQEQTNLYRLILLCSEPERLHVLDQASGEPT